MTPTWIGLLQGVALGVSIAAPVGPIGVLCIQRTLSKGRRSGIASGLGAATADAVYASIAGFGLTAVSAPLLEYRTGIRLAGGLLLIVLGVTAFRRPPATTAPKGTRTGTVTDGSGLAADYGSTFLLTIVNPVTILAFLGAVAGLGVGAAGDFGSAGAFVLGVFVGSVGWWLALSGLVSRFQDRFTPTAMRRVNHVAGAIVVGFGLVALSGLR